MKNDQDKSLVKNLKSTGSLGLDVIMVEQLVIQVQQQSLDPHTGERFGAFLSTVDLRTALLTDNEAPSTGSTAQHHGWLDQLHR